MKVLFLLHTSGNREGSSIAALAIIKQLIIRGYEVMAVLPSAGELAGDLQKVGAKTEILYFNAATWPVHYNLKTALTVPKRLIVRLWTNHFAERKLQRIVELFQPNVIHSNTGVLRVGYYVAKKERIPHVWHIRETEEGSHSYHYPSRAYQKHLLESNAFNIAITRIVKDDYCLKDANTKVIYDGVFEQSYKPRPRMSKSNYFLSVGRVDVTKGFDWVVKAFLLVAEKYPDYELWIAGKDDLPFGKQLKKQLNGIENSNRIKFLGIRNDVYELMAQAQAVIVASHMEGFGFVTVEAMLNNTIVIGRNIGGTKEQFDNGLELEGKEIGLRFDTIEELEEHIGNLCELGQEPYKEMIEAAQRVVRRLYTIESNVDQIEQVYKNVTECNL